MLCCGEITVNLSALCDSFFVLQGTVRVSKHCNEAVIMTDGNSSKDLGDDAHQTHGAVKMFLASCANSVSFSRWFEKQLVNRWLAFFYVCVCVSIQAIDARPDIKCPFCLC